MVVLIKMANSSFDYMIMDEGDDTMFYIDTSTNNVGIGDFGEIQLHVGSSEIVRMVMET